jgi:hypothetical protein
MKKSEIKVECISRLIDLTSCLEDILSYLLDEKIITQREVSAIKLENNKSKFLYEILEKAKNEEKLQLLTYDWTLLPVERIKIRLVTNRSSKEYVHN